MRAILSTAALTLLLTFTAAADDQDRVIRGCLMQMGEDFIVTDANGNKYEIDEKNDLLQAHLGHEVEIRGEFEGRSSDEDHNARVIDAKEVRRIANRCDQSKVAMVVVAPGAPNTTATNANPGATNTTPNTATTASSTANSTTKKTVDVDADDQAEINAAAPAATPEGSGVTTAGTTGPTTHIAGRVDPESGQTTTATAGGTSISPDATAAAAAPPDPRPFGQEQRTGETVGTDVTPDDTARVDADTSVDAAGRVSTSADVQTGADIAPETRNTTAGTAPCPPMQTQTGSTATDTARADSDMSASDTQRTAMAGSATEQTGTRTEQQLEGCVSTHTGGSYLLTARDGRRFELRGDQDNLREYVGKTIRVWAVAAPATGTVSSTTDAQAGTTPAEAQKPGDTNTANMGRPDVTPDVTVQPVAVQVRRVMPLAEACDTNLP